MTTREVKDTCKRTMSKLKEYNDSLTKQNVMTVKPHNVVPAESLRQVQLRVLDELKQFLTYTFGPMGSNTMILRGENSDMIHAEYSKDGHKVLKSIMYANPIEMTIQSEIEEITGYVEHEVGDGTTSAVILSSIIFKYLNMIMETYHNPPYDVIRTFKKVVSRIQDKILERRRNIDMNDIHKICMISTNGDVELSDMISNIYERFGLDVDISLGISNTTDTLLKEYDGLTIDEGYSDPAYINNPVDGTCVITDPKIYAFQDPINTPEMVSMFEKIIIDNIFTPAQEEEPLIPTVIIAPQISRDMSALITKVIEFMYQYKESMVTQRPPLLVVTNILGANEGIYHDIATMCGCKFIRKYVDLKIQERDIEQGLAATLDTIHNFAGSAERVVADTQKTKFINPKDMYCTDSDGNMVQSANFKMLYGFLESELANAKANNADITTIHILKKRMKSLNSNTVDLLVGGITISDRDSKKDLVEDAIKNCSSAAINGVGFAANYEGLIASIKVYGETCDELDLQSDISEYVMAAYFEAAIALYRTVTECDSDAIRMVVDSMENECPYNLYTMKPDDGVLCSIMTDVKILDAISKIISIMVTSNQCIVQVPALNNY